MLGRFGRDSKELAGDCLALTSDLEAALVRGEFLLEYQPKARTEDRRIVGFEALVRWRHPKLGLVPPSLFIPVAETNGLISPIGEWVLREACREAATWGDHLRVAVNVSPLQFRNRGFAALVAGILMQTGVSPRRLELEITETTLADDFSHAISTLTDLKMLGVQISMDDFGIGYSNLALLQSFSFNMLKLDGSFTSGLFRVPQAATIIRAIVNLAHAIGATVTAERVETEEQCAFFSNEGCEEIQGYLVGSPRAVAAYRDVLGMPTPRARPAHGLSVVGSDPVPALEPRIALQR